MSRGHYEIGCRTLCRLVAAEGLTLGVGSYAILSDLGSQEWESRSADETVVGWHRLSLVITKVRAQGYVLSEGQILTGPTDCRAAPTIDMRPPLLPLACTDPSVRLTAEYIPETPVALNAWAERISKH